MIDVMYTFITLAVNTASSSLGLLGKSALFTVQY